jgi:hypothetical protein
MVLVLTYFVTVKFLLLLMYLSCIPFRYFLQRLVKGHQGTFLFFLESVVFSRDTERPGCCGPGVFVAEEVDLAEGKGLGNTTSRDILGCLLENVHTGNSFPQLPKYLAFQNISIRIKGVLLYIVYRVEFIAISSSEGIQSVL